MAVAVIKEKLICLRDVLVAAKKNNGGDFRSFAALINFVFEEEGLATKSALSNIANHGAKTSGEKRLLAWICDFTFSEELGRPYQREELLALNRGDMSIEDLKNYASNRKMRVLSHFRKHMAEPSTVSYLILDILDHDKIDRDQFCARTGIIVPERLEEIIAGYEPTTEEYEVIAVALNHNGETSWTGAALCRLYRKQSELSANDSINGSA